MELPSHPEAEDERPHPGRRPSASTTTVLVVAAAVTLLAVVVILHLSGVVGPTSR